MPILFIFILFMVGCSSHHKHHAQHIDRNAHTLERETLDKRYQFAQDRPPTSAKNLDNIAPITPIFEAYSHQGNTNYVRFGQLFEIIKQPQGFTQTGQTSWYGKKFHGHLTSNGETYDMFTLSAAHKTLPLPSYIKVTNLDNNKSLIVRVNDRGPFHSDRILDLSYASAHKLGVLESGTSNIKIQVVPEQIHTLSPPEYWVQIYSLTSPQNAKNLAHELSQALDIEINVKKHQNNYRIKAGSFKDLKVAQNTLKNIHELGYPSAFIIKTKHN